MRLRMFSLAEALEQRLKMTSKRTTYRRLSLKPLHPLLYVSAEDTIEIPQEDIIPEQVGKKAFGLSCLPQVWTLPFIVVSHELLILYGRCRGDNPNLLINQWVKNILAGALAVGIKNEDQIIVRSSGCSEGLVERGRFYSSAGTLGNIHQPLQECLLKLASDPDLNKDKIPLVIQKHALPISAKGHLSNERRCYEEKRDWLGEFTETKTGKFFQAFTINLRNWREQINVNKRMGEKLKCNLKAHILKILKIPAAWGYERGIRLHFEWVWDGEAIYLVQADREQKSHGEDPMVIFQSLRALSIGFAPKCLKEITEDHAIRYKKVSNVFTYSKLGLPIIKLFILDDQSVIDGLADGQVSIELKNDLSDLVKGSLIIRMDIATDDFNLRQLLPRSDEVRDLNSALTWVKDKSKEIKEQKIKNDVAFIFHNFVPSVSSAFAYAAPRERKVQIEALWGLPEGLYYNAHDKYIVDTKNPQGDKLRNKDIAKFKVKEKRYFKRFFVAPDKYGHWATRALKAPYDWRGSIQREEWVKEIALESRRIAEEEKKPISIMWFVGVPSVVLQRPIFPWYHEPCDLKIVSGAPKQRTKTPFDKSLEIRTKADVETLRQEAAKEHSMVRRVSIKPQQESLLRDKNTLSVIGELTQKIGAIILLEGGVLSHAYYQLMKTNAIVEVVHPFEDLEDKQEFNKLVRDKVPSNIEGVGEVVNKTRLHGEWFERALLEKLIEEAFEVLDAVDQESIINELADVLEVVDGILSHLGVSKKELQIQQDQKRERAGGFKDGFVLLDTKNPLPTKAKVKTDALFGDTKQNVTKNSSHIDDQVVFELSRKFDKRSDRREHQAAAEKILQLLVPMVRDSWEANIPETVIESKSGSAVPVKIKITGTRSGARIQIGLSLFTPPQQLKLF